jgi:hypothetical protein
MEGARDIISRSGFSVTIASDMNTSRKQNIIKQIIKNLWNIPFTIQKIVAKKADKAKGIPNHRLKKTGQICDQDPRERNTTS